MDGAQRGLVEALERSRMTPVRFGVHDRVGEPVAVGVGPAERVQKLVQQNIDPVAFPGDTGVVEQHAGGQYHAGLVGEAAWKVGE